MEKLYNNIILNDGFSNKMSDASDVPYLKNPPEIIDVSVGRQLFVDDFLIEENNLRPEYHKAKKFEGNPVLYPEKSWEIEQAPAACPKSGGVWYDEEEKIFKMWYEAGWLRNMCYATSADGVHWKRSDLDIEPGTNKILTYEGYEQEAFKSGVSYLRPDSTTVFIDYDCPENEKYKLFLRSPGLKFPGIVAVSGDGIHFDKFKSSGEVYDRSTMFYNPFRKKWVFSIRDIDKPLSDPTWKRIRSYYECDDYIEGANWKEEDAHKWMSCDGLDTPNPYVGFEPQLYNVDCVGYESIMLGMFQIMYGPENNICDQYGVPKITELIPMYSRDGYHFSRPSRESIINASIHKGAWDRGYVQSVGGTLIINGDELWIYYIGFAGDENHAKESWATSGMYCNGATGIAKLRRDGFVSMNGNGSLVTRKLTFTNKKSMFVNAKGKVQVKIFDSDGCEIATSRIFDGDSTKAEVVFDGFDISTLNNKVFQIEFIVDGELYSFGFADEKGDFGGARAAGIVK